MYGKLNKDDNACEGVPQAGMTDLGDALVVYGVIADNSPGLSPKKNNRIILL